MSRAWVRAFGAFCALSMMLAGAAATAGTRTGNPGIAKFLRDESILSAPEAGAKAVAGVRLGAPAEILERKGPWYRVSSGKSEGWVRMFSIKFMPSAGAAVRGFRTRSAVIGVRGLGEVELKEAKPDPAQLERLDAYAVSDEELAAFERHGKQRLRSISVSGSGGGDPKRDQLELKMGREAAAAVLGAAPLLEDEAIQRYVNRVGRWVARASDRPGLPWRFGVIRSDAINAFAVPAGTVLVTLGLYRLLSTEAELAGVLAHEIAHVVRGHHFAIMMQSRAMEMMAEKTKKMKVSAGAVQAMLHKMVVKGAEIFTRALDRETEFDSDRMAMILAADAGYDPYGLPRVIQLLARSTPEEPPAALIYKTHPDPLARVERFAEFSSGGRVAELKNRLELRERFEKFSLYGVELRR